MQHKRLGTGHTVPPEQQISLQILGKVVVCGGQREMQGRRRRCWDEGEDAGVDGELEGWRGRCREMVENGGSAQE